MDSRQKNVVSITTFNKESYDSYLINTRVNEQDKTYYPMVIGGVVGACDLNNVSDCVIAEENVYYNAYAYNEFNASYKENTGDKTISAVGALSRLESDNPKENFTAYNFVMENLLIEVGDTIGANIAGAIGYTYVCLVSDGIKEKDEDGDYYSYKPFGSGSETVIGRRTEVFAPFIIEGYYEFDNDDDATPVIKQIEKVATLYDLFIVEGNNIYLQGSDLYKISLISDSSASNWQGVKDFNGYTLILNTDIQINSNWKGIKVFRGTFDGNGKVLDFTQLTEDNPGFIITANGAGVKNVSFRNVSLNASGDSGIIQRGTNIALDMVSVYVDSVTPATNTGVLVGVLNGRYNIINRCYVVFNNKLTANNFGAFVGTSNGSIKIQSSYSNNSVSGTEAIALINTLASGQTISLSNCVLHNNSSTSPDFVKTNDGTVENSTSYISYSSDIKKPDGSLVGNAISQSFFTENANWLYNNQVTTPFAEGSIWKYESASSVFPTHNFDDTVVIVYDGVGEYNDATRTYTLHNSLNLLNFANAINNGTLANGGDGYTFELDNDINGLHYVQIGDDENEQYYIYDYDANANTGYILYKDGLQYTVTINSDATDDVIINGLTINENQIYGTHIQKTIPAIGTEARPFRGTFSGNINTISNITFVGFVSSTNSAYVGMFGKIQDATIKLFILDNCTFEFTNLDGNTITQDVNYLYAGGVVGVAVSSEINGVGVGYGKDNTSLPCYMNVKADVNNVAYFGGIAGYAQTITIKNVFVYVNVTNSTEITGTHTQGIIVGYLIRHQAYTSNFKCSVSEIDETQADESARYPELEYISSSFGSGSSYNAISYYGEKITTNNDVYNIL